MSGADERISIIVPVYNAGGYIEETIRMVEAQTFSDWELILVDDCSTDNSRQIIQDYLALRADQKNAIRLIEKDKNQGAAMARNTGVDAAGGRYIAFLDADDVWMPEKLERELFFMRQKQIGRAHV